MQLSDRVALLTELAVLEQEACKRAGYKITRYFPDDGPLRRDLYVSAIEFFAGGARYPERLLMGGNRVGKTEDAAYEVTCHMTGLYPPWWTGRRFDHPVDVWAAGDTASTTRDIIQLSLYGKVPDAPRSGMVPGHLITSSSPKNSIPNAIEMFSVRHVSGGNSTIQFKSYDQRRDAFQGTEKHIIWLDEEPPEDIYTECLLRTLTCQGIVICTFTPVEGLTQFVQQWLENGVMFAETKSDEGKITKVPVHAEAQVFEESAPDPSDPLPSQVDAQRLPVDKRQKLITMISWDEVPHLSEQAKTQMMSSIPPYQRAARTRGIPNLGSGVIYPIPEDEIKVRPFELPATWRRGYGMDVGWNWTVALHGAWDPDTDIIYFYREHYRSHAEPPVHALGIRAPGDWIPGRIDPAANGRSQPDGRQLFQSYVDLGLILDIAPNGVEAGITDVWTRLTSGRIKIFSSCRNFFTEYRMYRRDKKGRIVKQHDHLMDAMRYFVASSTGWLIAPPANVGRSSRVGNQSSRGSNSWMG